MPKFAISLIGMRRPEGTRQCLATMLQHAGNDVHFFVTANGCPQTAEMFRAFAKDRPFITVTENAENIGFQIPHARQFASAARMGCQYVLVANDDISVPPGFLEALSGPMEHDSRVAITGPRGVCGFLNNDFHGQDGHGQPEYIEMSCGMIRVDAIRRLRPDLWCPGIRFAYGEDSSLCLYVREKGLTIQQVDIDVQHVRNATVSGNEDVRRVCMEAQRHNHEVGLKRWQYYLTRRRFDFPVVVRRPHSIGDVILTTPIIRALRKTMPQCPIYVETDVPSVFDRNPHVTQAKGIIPKMSGELRINLDMAYERRPRAHILHAYEAEVREQLPGLEPVEFKTELFPSAEDRQWAENAIKEINGGGRPVAVLHMDHTHWTGRNLPHERFIELAEHLHGRGMDCVCVGRNPIPAIRARDFIGKTTIHQLAALCEKARLYVGTCTGPLHVAQAMGCPTLAAFGVTSARYILTHRGPSVGIEGIGIDAGLRHESSGEVYVGGTGEAIRSVTTEQLQRGVELLLQ